ncbi:unnamed protein product [Adineta steineri]|uniref:Lipocalin/cytosolic fatty-acid binding domain-containing protein n=2 Tax=Adineta steineri TaxID=433720 RepID=A0A818URV2_9BILA|nr:unnamed protein product [Adineta steineri]CAF3696761.1 unnamed protein product [Adineta steineri]
MLFLIKITLLVLTYQLTSASLCPRIVTQKDFNITKYGGIWYEVYRHDINGVASKCENETLTINSNGTMNVWTQGVSEINGYYSNHGLAVVKKASERGAFLIHLTNPHETIKYNIITTDYNQYSLIFSCDHVPILDINFEHIWILSRTKTLSMDIVKELKKVLKHMHVHTDDIKPTSQDC